MKCLSVDIGGSKTRAVLYDAQGHKINEIITESCHILQVDEIEVIKRLSKCSLLADSDTFVVLGFAGYGEDGFLKQKITTIVNQVFGKYQYYIVNDAMMAFKASLDNHDGIMAVVGTGSIAISVNQDNYRRAGGFGHLLSDGGSGYDIGHQALKLFCQMIDGIIEKSPLYDVVRNFYHLDNDYEIIKLVNTDDYRFRVASLTKAIINIDDEHIRKILDAGAKEIAGLINHLAKDFEGEVLASAVGGVILNNEYYFNLIHQYLNSNIKFIKPLHEINYGGYLIMRDLYNGLRD